MSSFSGAPPVNLPSPSKPTAPNNPSIATSKKPVTYYYACLLSTGKELGVVSTSNGLRAATAACNHRISACIIDYESSGNNDGNFGGDGGCLAIIQGKPNEGGETAMSLG